MNDLTVRCQRPNQATSPGLTAWLRFFRERQMHKRPHHSNAEKQSAAAPHLESSTPRNAAGFVVREISAAQRQYRYAATTLITPSPATLLREWPGRTGRHCLVAVFPSARHVVVAMDARHMLASIFSNFQPLWNTTPLTLFQEEASHETCTRPQPGRSHRRV